MCALIYYWFADSLIHRFLCRELSWVVFILFHQLIGLLLLIKFIAFESCTMMMLMMMMMAVVMSHYITHNITKGTVKSNQLILPLSRYLSAVSFLYKLHIMCALLKIYRLVNCGWRVCASVCACILLYKYLLDLGEAMTVQLCMNFKGKIVAFLNEHTLFIYEWMKDRQIVYMCVCLCVYLYLCCNNWCAHTINRKYFHHILVGMDICSTAFSLMMSSPVSDF